MLPFGSVCEAAFVQAHQLKLLREHQQFILGAFQEMTIAVAGKFGMGGGRVRDEGAPVGDVLRDVVELHIARRILEVGAGRGDPQARAYVASSAIDGGCPPLSNER